MSRFEILEISPPELEALVTEPTRCEICGRCGMLRLLEKGEWQVSGAACDGVPIVVAEGDSAEAVRRSEANDI